MKVKIKKLCESAVIPQYAHVTDAGLDLVATSKLCDEYDNVVYGTGITVEIPEGYVGLLFPRSSNCKKNVWLTNAVGVIDSGYRGEITFKYRPTYQAKINEGMRNGIVNEYEIGDRIGQLIIMPYPQIEFEEADELSETERGVGGYGSTGK